jgi:hypothetical protein
MAATTKPLKGLKDKTDKPLYLQPVLANINLQKNKAQEQHSF